MNILFSQVREDSDVELYVDNLFKDYKKYLLVGSGGCTLFTLLSVIEPDANFSIDIIDQNIEQIYLIKLKLAVIKYFNDKERILDFFEGCFKPTEYDEIFNCLILENDCKTFWENNKNFIYSGINQGGTFERLFKELVDNDYNFEKVFDKNNLIEKFGSDAVVNSLNQEFYDHFRNIMENYQKNYKIEDNYFYYQIVNNKYERNCLPKYFDNLDKVITNSSKVNYICSDFFEYVSANASQIDIKYNMIHTSNLTDWLNIQKLDTLLNNLNELLVPDGYIVMRRLNGDYQLKEIVRNKFNILNIDIHDKSEFYKEVVIGFK